MGSKIEQLYPGYFALVMATGIVSIAAFLLELPGLAWFLFVLNNGFYLGLVVATIFRAVWYSAAMWADLSSHSVGPTFFTWVAGTCVLGMQYRLLAQEPLIALGLWFAGGVLWLFLNYAFFTLITVCNEKPTLEHGLNGAWLLVVVATQALSVLGTTLASDVGAWSEIVLFSTFCLCLLGGFFYVLMITLIFLRFTFGRLVPVDLTPPYWINMGAVAITTLAAAALASSEGLSPLISELSAFCKGLAMLFWGIATWWIPLLLLLGCWRHVAKRVPFRYHPAYWGMVFPLGMYTTATVRLAQATDSTWLMPLPAMFFWLALTAWIIVLVGMCASVVREMRMEER